MDSSWSQSQNAELPAVLERSLALTRSTNVFSGANSILQREHKSLSVHNREIVQLPPQFVFGSAAKPRPKNTLSQVAQIQTWKGHHCGQTKAGFAVGLGKRCVCHLHRHTPTHTHTPQHKHSNVSLFRGFSEKPWLHHSHRAAWGL